VLASREYGLAVQVRVEKPSGRRVAPVRRIGGSVRVADQRYVLSIASYGSLAVLGLVGRAVGSVSGSAVSSMIA
jgi:hypothetical protein